MFPGLFVPLFWYIDSFLSLWIWHVPRWLCCDITLVIGLTARRVDACSSRRGQLLPCGEEDSAVILQNAISQRRERTNFCRFRGSKEVFRVKIYIRDIRDVYISCVRSQVSQLGLRFWNNRSVSVKHSAIMGVQQLFNPVLSIQLSCSPTARDKSFLTIYQRESLDLILSFQLC